MLETVETSSPKEGNEKSSAEEQRRDTHPPQQAGTTIVSTDKPSPKASKSFGEKIMDTIEAVRNFGVRHPVLTRVLETAVAVGAGVAIANSNSSSGGGLDAASLGDYSSSSSNDGYTDSLVADISDDSSSGRDYPDERSSPEEHTVQAHRQRYHTKDGVIWIEKETYPRGGKHDED